MGPLTFARMFVYSHKTAKNSFVLPSKPVYNSYQLNKKPNFECWIESGGTMKHRGEFHVRLRPHG
ncbi:hypothetical protein SAMN02799630_04492 [Paenibacillus sp. UNCCL117]|nr:hypothetical protein SAMN04488602_117101 [Paenibacillus sp. cl123]SFW57608.1 hypothetical protein SAMN02799630_04492 [Paenibacillus sp. UNCCL117]